MNFYIFAWFLCNLIYSSYSTISDLNNSDPIFTGPINNVTVPAARDAVLTCSVYNLLNYKIAWLRVDTQTILSIQNHVITKNHRISISHSEHRIWQLRIRNVSEADRGWYMCQINTDPMKSQVGYLDVVVPPDINDQRTSHDLVARSGDNLTLTCGATGVPAPTIIWRREKDLPLFKINGKEVFSIEGPNLTLNHVNREQVGGYLCIASNGVPPTVSKRILLMINFIPKIFTQYDSIYIGYNQKVTMECISESYPNSVNFWLKDREYLQGGTYHGITIDYIYKIVMRLTITTTNAKDFGEYKCVAKNVMGKSERAITLLHKAKIDKIQNRQQISNSGNHYILIEEYSSMSARSGKPRELFIVCLIFCITYYIILCLNIN